MPGTGNMLYALPGTLECRIRAVMRQTRSAANNNHDPKTMRLQRQAAIHGLLALQGTTICTQLAFVTVPDNRIANVKTCLNQIRTL